MSHGRHGTHISEEMSYGQNLATNQRRHSNAGIPPNDHEVTRARMMSSEPHRNSNNIRPSMSTDPPQYSSVRRASGSDRMLAVTNQPRRSSQNQNLSHSQSRRGSDLGHSRIRLDEGSNPGQRRRQGSLPILYTADPEREAQARRARRTEMFAVSSARSRSTTRTLDTDYDGHEDKYVVPALPPLVAVLCCILNFLVPGLGSMLASVCVFCCANTDDMTCDEKCGSCGTVFCIGVLQLLLVACFLIGWIWSCIWGIAFIANSANYGMDEEFYDERASEYRRRERNSRGRTSLPAPEVVVDQPYPGVGYEDVRREQERRRQRREVQRRSRSRISLTPSNFIYPMRAPSNIAYNSPPPPYRETEQTFTRDGEMRRSNRARDQENGYRSSGHVAETIYEEHIRR